MEKTTFIKRALLLFAGALFACATSWAHDFVVDGIYYNITGDGEVEVTYEGDSYSAYTNEYTGTVTIPATVEYNGTVYAVTSIGERAFYDCSSLEEIIIGENVVSIGYESFAHCTSLTEVEIPDNVVTIGEGSFSGCSSLEKVTIGDGVTDIGLNAFGICTSLTEVVLGASVTNIEDSAFFLCNSITTITSNNPVPPSLNASSFSGDTSNITVYVPEGSYDAYATADVWQDFNIYGGDTSGIEEISAGDAAAIEVARYDISGRLLSAPQTGVNIVLYSDGTAEKVIVK